MADVRESWPKVASCLCVQVNSSVSHVHDSSAFKLLIQQEMVQPTITQSSHEVRMIESSLGIKRRDYLMLLLVDHIFVSDLIAIVFDYTTELTSTMWEHNHDFQKELQQTREQHDLDDLLEEYYKGKRKREENPLCQYL